MRAQAGEATAAGESPSERQRRRSLAAVIAVMGVNTVIYSLSYPLFSLVLHERGVTADLIGYSTAAQAGAAFVMAPLAPRLIAHLGPMVIMVTCLLASAGLFALFPLLDSTLGWTLLRFALGALGTVMWIAGEALVNHLAVERSRGRTIAVYTMSLSAGFAVGPLVLTLTGTSGAAPFVAAAVIVALSALPLALVRAPLDAMRDGNSGGLWQALRKAPVPMLTNLVFAMVSGVMITFFPIYGLAVGLDQATTLLLITVGAIGGIALQPLAGRLADRMDRLLLLALFVAAALLVTALMPWLIALAFWNFVYVFLYTGLRTGIYSLSVTLMGERFRGVELAAASALFNLMWSLGSMLGPGIGGLAMRAWEPHGVPASIALMLALLLPLPLLARRRARRLASQGAGPAAGA